MFLPISDENEHGHRYHHQDFIQYSLIIASVVMYAVTFYMQHWMPGALIMLEQHWTFLPNEYLGADFPILPFGERLARIGNMLADHGFKVSGKIILSSFLHGSVAHLAGNMFILWMLGDNIEYAMGHLRYLLFYLFVAMFSQILELFAFTAAYNGPSIGASGAIMGVAGAYMFYFPKARVNIFYITTKIWPIFPREWTAGFTSIPARLFIGFFAVTDIITAYKGWGTDYEHIGVWAHVIGFLLGLALAWPLCKYSVDEMQQPRVIEPFQKPLREFLHDHDPWGDAR